MPLRRDPMPLMSTRCPARRSGSPIVVPLAFTISFSRSFSIAIARFLASFSVKKGSSTTISSRGSQSTSSLWRLLFVLNSLSSSDTLTVIGFFVLRFHPLTVTDLTWFAVVSVFDNSTGTLIVTCGGVWFGAQLMKIFESPEGEGRRTAAREIWLHCGERPCEHHSQVKKPHVAHAHLHLFITGFEDVVERAI